ncbi:hypothetical protein GCM10022221_28610 [Actinocorallia aurea]
MSERGDAEFERAAEQTAVGKGVIGFLVLALIGAVIAGIVVGCENEKAHPASSFPGAEVAGVGAGR